MNYTKIYHRIISHAQQVPRTGYTENHHIIPKSLGGTDEANNLVRLTAREHFVCHRLLTKMYDGEQKIKMIHAAWAMATLCNEHQERYKINSRTYAVLREEYSDVARHRMKNMSQSQRQHLSEIMKKRPGKPHTNETKQKLREFNLGKQMSDDTKAKISETLKSKYDSGEINTYIRTDEQRKSHSDKLKGRKPSNSERENYLNAMNVRYECEYCGKSIKGKGNFNRWHGERCREKK